MTIPGLDELKKLSTGRVGPCISIYIPTHVKGAEILQDHIRLKNHIREIERELKEMGINTLIIKEMLRKPLGLIEDDSFWNYQTNGLAVFFSPDEFFYYQLPVNVEEKHVISKRFCINPLLQFTSRTRNFYILALDQRSIHLYNASPYMYEEVPLNDNIPQNLADFLGPEQSEQKKYVRGEAGSPNMKFYTGPAGGTDDAKHNREILRFFQAVDKGLFNIVKEDSKPMVLTGAEFLLPLYHEANSYRNIVTQGIPGVPGDLGMDVIYKHALQIMAPYYEEDVQKALARFGELSNGEKTSTTIGTIVKAAFSKRIETLFINPAYRQWGIFDPNEFTVTLHNNYHEGDEDITDLVSSQTLLNGGQVFELEEQHMPKIKPMAAVFRY
ncbi:MAG: hypothetical protein ACM3Q2_04440 [Syntrophothermus sp.]